MNGVKVATLYKDLSGNLRLIYETSWLENPRARQISFSLPLQSQPLEGSSVLNYFQNLLPDSSRVLGRIAREFKITSSNPFDILAVIGKDCVGALQFVRDDSEAITDNSIVSIPLSDKEIENRLRIASQQPLGMDEEEDFRISLAGAQEKTALLFRDGQWHLPLRATPTSHILKLPIGVISANSIDLSDSCENEWFCLKLARYFGLNAADAEIWRFGEIKALAVKRFDRRWSEDGTKLFRLPTEDFCQIFGVDPIQKYESEGGPGIIEIMKTLDYSVSAQEDKVAFLRAQVFLWLTDSTDGHAKNYSVFIRPQNGFSLTPFYDLLSVSPLVRNGVLSAKKIKLAMALSGKSRHYKISEIMPRHFIETAVKCGVSEEVMRNIFVRFVRLGDELETGFESKLPAGFPTDVSAPVLESVRKKLRLIKACLSVVGQ
jgi:serine/threonine-protein kinase HipA